MPPNPNIDPAHLRRLALLLALPDPDALGVLNDLTAHEPWLAEPITELAVYTLEEWQAEFNRLFVAGYPHTPCPPYESAYREGWMNGRSIQSLAELYGRAGLVAQAMPADYLGTQLEFAAYLWEGASIQLDMAKTAGHADGPSLSPAQATDPQACAAALWEEHLCQWLPRFAQDLQIHARLLLYQRLGEQLAELCAGCEHDG